MNENKICFIINVHDEVKYQESLKYINALDIPPGIEIEIMKKAKRLNTPIAYNEAMFSSNAKYKIYLDESVCIIDKQFLFTLIDIFKSSQEIGMIGAIGAKQIPSTFNWIESNFKVGSVYTIRGNTQELVEYSPAASVFEEVIALDRSILATQYDIPFSEDALAYDLSQSVKYIEEGYKIGVIVKKQPIIILDRKLTTEIPSNFSIEIKTINSRLHIEGKSDLPLVSILIPTYNRPEYFELALKSALEQTYKNIEIVISDDSTNNLTESLVKNNYLPYYNHIRYIRNETNLGQFENDLRLIELSSGEYINFLMDDDLFHPEKIEKMMGYYLADSKKEITLVTSHRRLINEDGELYKEEGVTQKVFKEDTVMDGKELGNIFLKNNFNFIGEPTTVLFRKRDLTEPFGTFAGRKYGCNVDSATWLTLLSKGKGVYISETLSFFRIHGNQQLQSDNMKVLGAADYAHEVLTASSCGFLADLKDYREAVTKCINYCKKILSSTLLDSPGSSLEEIKKYVLKLESIQRLFNESENTSNNTIDYFSKGTIKVFEDDTPLVSILIPAYNRPKYLERALQSVLIQTYPNIEIVICDDSTNNDVQTMIQPYLKQYNNIRYYRNEIRLKNRNVDKCLNLAQGEYINFLLDDDCFYPEKIAKMVEVLSRCNDIKLVTSYRTAIDHNGEKIIDPNLIPPKVFKEDFKASGEVFINLSLLNLINFIGELTTAMFRKSDVPEGIALFDGYEYQNIQDLALWIHLLSQGKCVYLSEPLSYYRIHNEQNAKKADIMFHSIKEWHMIINYAYRKNLLSKKDYINSLINYMKVTMNLLESLFNKEIKVDMEINQDIRKAINDSICNITNFILDSEK